MRKSRGEEREEEEEDEEEELRRVNSLPIPKGAGAILSFVASSPSCFVRPS